jgi:hypothetical protein
VKRFLAAEHALLFLAPSDVCTNARALAANPQVTPPATLQWLATYGRTNNAEGNALDAFLKVLRRFETPADAAVIKDIGRDASRAYTAQKTLMETEALKLLAALGLAA